MTLTLSIVNVDRLDNGEATRLVLDRHGAVIGRSPHVDWSLPDPKSHISSTHMEIDYRDGAYVLFDKSTNGTFLNGAAERLASPHVLVDGDQITIGQYQLIARLAGGVAAAAPSSTKSASGGGWGWGEPAVAPAESPGSSPWEAAPSSGWGQTPPPPPGRTPAPPRDAGWGSASAQAATPMNGGGWEHETPRVATGWAGTPVESAPVFGPSSGRSGWDTIESDRQVGPAIGAPSAWESAPAPAISGRGSMSQNWAAPAARAPESQPAPAWGAEAPADDVWGRLASGNSVDWKRCGFGASDVGPEVDAPAWGSAPVSGSTGPSALRADRPPAPSAGPAGEAWPRFLEAAGLREGDIRAPPEQAAQTAGALLRRLVAGLTVMVEARARAKAQLGAQSTTLELDGNNPLKFTRSPERVLAQLLSPPERGFMPAERAVEDAFHDLQAHQMATLAAMQGALRATLERFSPDSIRNRAEMRGVLAKILPSARDATLWSAYEREFAGVARGSDEAFMEVFSKAFKTAYEQASGEMKSRSP